MGLSHTFEVVFTLKYFPGHSFSTSEHQNKQVGVVFEFYYYYFFYKKELIRANASEHNP
jgi:hypothetical protein